jgi:tetratricopeptide (TPR) repeat protein
MLLPLTAVAVIAIGLGLVRRNDGAVRLTARAESLQARPEPSSTRGPLPATASRVTAKPANLPGAPLHLKPATKSPALVSSAPPGVPEDTSVCANYARDGKIEQATDCYDGIARGTSVAAELALYEKARLESRALGNREQALRSLNEHSARFPKGVLHAEVSMTRIELLTRLGRTKEALLAIENALKGTVGQERGADLYALRGDLLSVQHDCDAAIEDYAEAKRLGVHPSRISAGMKRCEAVTKDAAVESSEP